MKKKKYFGKLAVTAVLIGSMLLNGCGKKEETLLDPDNPTTVAVWNYYNGDQLAAFEDLVREFNDTIGTEKGIVVESVSQGTIEDLATRLLEAVEGKVGAADVPALASVYAETGYILKQDDAVVPLDHYFSEEELKEYVPSFIEEGRFQDKGELYLLPVSKSTEALIVNETDWADFEKDTGISSDSIDNYEALTKAAENYYEWTDEQTPDVAEDGKALYGRDSVANYVYSGTTEMGKEIFKIDSDGKLTVNMDRDTFKKLWDNYYIPYINGYFTASANHRSEDLKTGTILAMTGSTSGVSYIADAVTDQDDVTHDIEVKIEKPLGFADTAQPVYVQQGAGYALMKTSETEQQAAVEFLKWFTDTEQNLDFSINSGYSPVKTEANDAEKIKKSFTVDSKKSQNMLDALVVSSEIFKSGNTYTCRAFEGSKDARDILADALEQTAIKDREAVVEKIKTGATREEATKEYSTEKYFDTWFDSLCKQIDTAVK